jgi:hypothetical protein
MFNPYGAGGMVNEGGGSVNRLRAGRHFGRHAGTACGKTSEICQGEKTGDP